MAKLAQKKNISVFTMSRIVKEMVGNDVRCSRKHLLTAAMVHNRLERSTRLFNNLNNHGNLFLTFPKKKTFTVDSTFNKQNDKVVTLGNDVSVYLSVNNQISSLTHDAWHHRIERLKYVFWFELPFTKKLWRQKIVSLDK